MCSVGEAPGTCLGTPALKYHYSKCGFRNETESVKKSRTYHTLLVKTDQFCKCSS